MEQTQDGEVVDQETEKASDMEPAIKFAMRARVGHFKAQADSLTLEGVRRLLEKDLKLEKFALDVHKRFIKQCLEECFDGPDDENSKTLGDNVEEVVHSDEKNTTKSLEGLQLKKEAEPNSKDEKGGSPVLGLLREEKQHEDSQSAELDKVPSEGTIKKAIKKRAAYFRANSEEVTLVGARRLLEEDLGFDKYAFDTYKKFISDQLDEVLHGPEVAQSPNGIKKKPQNKESLSQVSKKVSRSRSSDSSDGENEEVEDDNIKPKKQITSKGKSGNSEVVKSRKRPASEIKSSSNKRKKPLEPTSEESSDEKDGNLSENGSHSSADEPVKKKKEVSAPAYGKHVEHLKSIIKACGLSITPSVYKKVKQAPENKRESYLIKELENILGREGLSTNPSEKEIKTVKKKKEREKELEGIDMSNIVSSSRRRSTTTYVAPTRPKIPVQSDGNDGKKNDDEDGDTDDDEDDDDEDDSSSDGTSEGLDEDVEDED